MKRSIHFHVSDAAVLMICLTLLLILSLGWTVSHDWSQVKNVNISSSQISENTIKESKLDSALRLKLIPAGTIIAFGGSDVPEGWLLCNGSNVSRNEYSYLFDAINISWGEGDGSTTFSLPDLRGAFLRGSGSNGKYAVANGSDFSGPEIGSFQNDSFQGHWHEVSYRKDAAGGGSGGYIAYIENSYSYDTIQYPIDDGTNGNPRAGSETRPFNAGVNYIIKY